MKPKNEHETLEIFKVRLEEIINQKHALVILSESINWESLEEKLTQKYSDWHTWQRDTLNVMAGLQYVKYMYNESDEMIVQKFIENPYYQFFCDNTFTTLKVIEIFAILFGNIHNCN